MIRWLLRPGRWSRGGPSPVRLAIPAEFRDNISMRIRGVTIVSLILVTLLAAPGRGDDGSAPPVLPPPAPATQQPTSPESPGTLPTAPPLSPDSPVMPATAPSTSTPPSNSADPASPTVPQRVIIEVNRNVTIHGVVHEEDGDMIIVRDVSGRIHSLHKTRVLRIVRLVDPKPDQPGTVILRDGSRQQGIIIKDDYDEVTLEIEGIRTRLLRESVDYVRLEPTFDERYQQYKTALQSWSAARHLELCRWLFAQRQYDLARKELQELLERDRYAPAVELLRTVDAQLALKSVPRPDHDRPGGGMRDDDRDADLPTQIITRDDVNIMRVYEIDFEHPPRVTVTADTIRKLIEDYGSNEQIPTGAAARTALFRADPLDIVRLMFQLRARELYPRIEVTSEPHSLNLFRQRVHNTWLISRCASTDCHGGVDAGRLFLHRRGYRDERVRSTNLLILERTRLDPDWPLINYRDPMLSLIIQHALPRDEARKPHPPVKGWEPVFNRGNRRLLDGTVEWIESMIEPRPEYPIAFQPPHVGGPPGDPAPHPGDERPEPSPVDPSPANDPPGR